MMRRRLTLLRSLPVTMAVGALAWTTPAAAAPSPDTTLGGGVSASVDDGSADASAAGTADASTTDDTVDTTDTSLDSSGGSAAPASAGGTAAASRGSSGARRFRLHTDTEFFGFTHFDDETDMPGPDTNVIGFGFGRSTMADSAACSLLALGSLGAGCILSVRPVWGLGFGYAFMEQRAVVGARFSFTVDGVFDDDDVDNDATTLVAGQFVPYFRFIFLPGNTIRPYAEVRFGLGGGSAILNAPGMMGADDVQTTVGIIYPTVGVGGGVHLFLIDAMSIDLGLNFDYFAPHSKFTVEPDPADISTDWEQVANVLNLAVLAGFSVWIP